jgi:hypothetical protein
MSEFEAERPDQAIEANSESRELLPEELEDIAGGAGGGSTSTNPIYQDKNTAGSNPILGATHD